MTPFKIVRKIGKMLRGGAGKKEIFLGALLGVLIGFNPTLSLTLFLAILITLLLNANIGFTLLGILLGKASSLALSHISFHTGFFLIHKIGLEGLFTKLSNTPVTALMDLNVYAMVGSLPYAIIIGILFGKFMTATVTKIREQMVKAGEREKVGKIAGNKFAKFLLWIAFGKQKISTADVLAKESPLLRKSGLILVGSVVVIVLVLQFFLLDLVLKKGLQAGISAQTGAEVNIDQADFSLAGGKLEIQNLQVTDPDKPTHNMIQIQTLAADLSVSDLLRKSYTIDLLSGSVLKRDVERTAPGKIYVKKKKAEEKAVEPEEDTEGGKSIDEYLAQAAKWKEYGKKAYDYLKERKENAEALEKGEKPKTVKEAAVADAEKLGYLKAAADLVATRPAWTIHEIEISQVELGGDMPPQQFQALEVSSHPELNARPSTFTMTPEGASEPTAKIVLHFDDPSALHEIQANLKGIDISKAVKTGDKLKIEEGKADLSAKGSFSLDTLNIPFTLLVHDLKTNNETLNALPRLELPGKLYGSLLSPRVKVEISDQLKDAAIDAAKEKAKAEAKKAVQKELDKALDSDDAKQLKSKAKDALKGLF